VESGNSHRALSKHSTMKSLLYAAALLALGGQVLGQTNDPLDHWQRYDPAPSNFFSSVGFLNGQFWGVGCGTVWGSQDGTNWACSGFVPMDVPLGIAYGNGTYVVVGEDGYDPELDGTAGLITTSPDGVVWTAQSGPPGYSVFGGPAGFWFPEAGPDGNAVVYGNGLFVVAVTLEDSTPAFLTSPDGVQWAIQTFGDIHAISSLIFGNGLFVALGYTGDFGAGGQSFLLTSQDGQLWTKHAGGTGGWLDWVGYGNGTFVLGSGLGQLQAVAASTDLQTWTTNAAQGTAGFYPGSIAYGDGVFVAAGGAGAVWTSPDGLQWASHDSGISNTLYSVANGNGVFVASSRSPPVTSSDGVHWTAAKPAIPVSMYDVVFARGRFVAVGQQTGSSADYPSQGVSMTSTDGAHWSIAYTGTTQCLSVVYADGLFVAVGGDQVVTSPDGLNWTPRVSGTANSIQSVAYGNGLLVGVGWSGTVITSTNGTDWISRNPATNVSMMQVVYGNGVFVALWESQDGSILVSTNGADWQIRDCGATDWVWGLGSGDGMLFVVGRQSLLVSTNGSDWFTLGSGIFPWYDTGNLKYAHGTFLIVCGSGDIYASTNATDWVLHNTGCGQDLSGLAYGNNTFVAVGEGGTILQSAPTPSWPLQLAPSGVPGPNGFSLTASGPAGHNWEIDASSDLLDWAPLANLWSTNGVITVTDPAATACARRFYHGQWW